MSGILSGPIDGFNRRRPAAWPSVEAVKGLTVRHRTSGCVGQVVKFNGSHVTLRDDQGREHMIPTLAGAFSVDGRTVTLVRPKPSKRSGPTETASGSVPPPRGPARVARPNRILVEGRHDAELVEKVWGDDLRAEGVVVEPLHGADDLAATVRDMDPGPQRRIGVLLDHLVPGTKEWRLAIGLDYPDVLVTGHPYIDIWQAVRPSVLGIDAWPVIERGTEWKTGVCATLGFRGTTAEMWATILGRVQSYRDLEPGLVGAVEQLIDFVAPPPADA